MKIFLLEGQAANLELIYLHKNGGNLDQTNQNDIQLDSDFEDTAAAFFDVDADGDNDLMVGSSGNQVGDGKNYGTSFISK